MRVPLPLNACARDLLEGNTNDLAIADHWAAAIAYNQQYGLQCLLFHRESRRKDRNNERKTSTNTERIVLTLQIT